jgi:signal transduction histidine kinase
MQSAPVPCEEQRPRRRWRPSRTDIALALSVAAFGVGDSLALPGNALLTGEPVWAAGVTGLVGFLVLWRHRFPRSMTGVVLLSHVVCNAPGPFAAMVYTVGGLYRTCRLRLLAVGLAALASKTAAAVLNGAGLDLIHGIAFVAAALLMGMYVAARHQLISAMREQAAERDRQQALLQEQARGVERTRIARELHDVVAHRVSHAVLAAGALQVSADRGTDWVAQQANRIRGIGAQALVELREILGVLTRGEEEGKVPLEPTPTAADLDTLIADCRQFGMEITWLRHGEIDTLPCSIQLAIYRVIQEALTNALKHAPGARITVELARRDRGVHVEVVNGPPTKPPDEILPSGGYGLMGLAERLRVLGGTLEASAQPAGAFCVRAIIPLPRDHPERAALSPADGACRDQSHGRG